MQEAVLNFRNEEFWLDIILYHDLYNASSNEHIQFFMD